MTESAQSDQIVERMIGIGRSITLPINMMDAQAGRMPAEATHLTVPFDSTSTIAIKLSEALPFRKRLSTALAENLAWNSLNFAALTAKPLGFEQMVSLLRGDAEHFGTSFTMDLARKRLSFAATGTNPLCSELVSPSLFIAASGFGTAFTKDSTRACRRLMTLGTDALTHKSPILSFGMSQAFLCTSLTTGFARTRGGFAAIHTDTLGFEFSISFLVHSCPPKNIIAQEQEHAK